MSPWRSGPVALLISIATVVSTIAAADRHLATLPARTEPAVLVSAPVRGTIFDRSGRVVIARTELLARLVADRPSSEVEAERIATLIARIAGRDHAELVARLTAPGVWRIVERAPFSGEALSALRELETDGALSPARLETVVRRVHAAGGIDGTSLASQLLGFVDADGLGHYGVESFYDSQLAGYPGSERIERDGSRTVLIPTRDGADLTLSIDAGLQRVCEALAGRAHLADEAFGISIAALDVNTGELLASASSPSYDASAPGAGDEEWWLDPLVSRPFDPGSVMKPFSVLTALGAGVAEEDEKMTDQRRLLMPDGSGSVGNWDGRSVGAVSVADGLILSRNVITSLLALRLGTTPQAAAERLVPQYRAFGFGSQSGIDLANESGGIVRDPASSRWRAIDVANASFGQGVSITPLGMLTAYAALANGGVLLRPRVTLAVGGETTPVTVRGTATDPALAARIRAVLERALADRSYRTAHEQLPAGWSGGGKTGTAEIYDPESRTWLRGVANFSMAGWIGRENPEVAIFVTIWQARPTGALFYLPVSSRQLWGSVAREIARRIDDGRLVLTGQTR